MVDLIEGAVSLSIVMFQTTATKQLHLSYILCGLHTAFHKLFRDDPLASDPFVPKDAIGERLRIMFDRKIHPTLFDQIERRLTRAGIVMRPSHMVSHPSDLQFLVKEGTGLGLIRKGLPLDPELTSRPIAGVPLPVETAFICHETQQRPVLPLLAYRVAKCCAEGADANRRKKPVRRVEQANLEQHRKPKGLLIGKRATFLIATGGIYDAQTQMASLNFVEPYLRSLFGFLGVKDATFLTAGGTKVLSQGHDRDAFLAPLIQTVQTHVQSLEGVAV